MLDEITRVSHFFEIHLLYASIVWLAAWALTSIRRGTATTKYWIWVATSLNFVFPLSAVLDGFRPSRPSWMTMLNVMGGAGTGLSRDVSAILSVAWSLGALLMLLRLCLRIRADHRHAQASSGKTPRESYIAHGIPVRFAVSREAPAVDGVLRPHISLPDGIDRLLSEHELNAVLIHELTHARRRDNLIRLIHEVALCVLWFHPLVWITGHRLALYRELSCDESVIQRDHGGHLVSALAKLVHGDDALVLQATASSFMSHRLALLTAGPRRTRLATSTLPAVVFGAALLAGILGTAAQTAGSSPLAVFGLAPCPEELTTHKEHIPPARHRVRTNVGGATNPLLRDSS